MDETQDVITGSSSVNEPEESLPSQDENVPFHQHPRFKELIEEKNALREELSSLKSLLESKDHAPAPQEESTDLPDIFDNPKEFAEYVKQQAKAEMLADMESKKQAELSARKFIDDQYEKLHAEHGEFDEDAIGRFAIDHNIRHQNGGYDLINAFKLMKQIDKAKEEAKSETMDTVKRVKSAPVSGGGSSTKDVPIPKFTQDSLRKMSMGALINRLSKQ